MAPTNFAETELLQISKLNTTSVNVFVFKPALSKISLISRKRNMFSINIAYLNRLSGKQCKLLGGGFVITILWAGVSCKRDQKNFNN